MRFVSASPAIAPTVARFFGTLGVAAKTSTLLAVAVAIAAVILVGVNLPSGIFPRQAELLPFPPPQNTQNTSDDIEMDYVAGLPFDPPAP